MGVLDAGSARVRLEGVFEPTGFNRFTRAVREARSEPNVTTHLRTDADLRGADRYTRALHDVDRQHDMTVKSSGRVRTAFGSVWGAGGAAFAAAGGLYALGAGLKGSLDAYRDAERAARQTNAVLKSTGGVAGVTAKDIDTLTTALMKKTAVDDDTIRKGANLLLTFTNVRNEAGKGKDIFNQTTAAALDMSTALGTDLNSSVMMLGKALNDPEAGMTRLTRSGVTFTEQQKKAVAELQKTGDLAGAQSIILKEVSREFGGSAAAAVTPWQRLQVTIGNVAEIIGKPLAAGVDFVATKLNNLILGFQNGSKSTAGFITTLKQGVGFIRESVGGTLDFINTLIDDNTDNFVHMGQEVQKLAAPIKRTFMEVKEAVSDALSGNDGIAQNVRETVDSLTDIAEFVTKYFFVPIVQKALPGIEKALKGLVQVVKGITEVIAGILTLNFDKAWKGVKDIFGGGIKEVIGILTYYTAPIRLAAGFIWRGIEQGATAAWDFITGVVRDGIDSILGGVTTVMGAIEKVINVGSKLPFVGGKFRGLTDDIKNARGEIDKYRESLRKTDEQHAKQQNIRTLQQQVGGLKDKLNTLRKGTDDYRETADRLKSKQQQLNTAMNDARAAGNRGAQGIGAIGAAADATSLTTAEAMQAVSQNVNNLAKQLGVKGINFKVANTPSKARAASNVFGGGFFQPGMDPASQVGQLDHKARGGFLEGSGLQDTEMVMAAPGEAFLTRHDQPWVDTAMQVASSLGIIPYDSLDAMFNSGNRKPHWMARGGRLPGFATGGVMQRANFLDRLKLPYIWGGHHGDAGPIKDPRPGLDCSSAVSYVLGIPPRVSGALMNIGDPGRGPITVFANPTHTFMSIAGRGFGTSHENPGGGPGWLSYNSRSGFAVRSVQGALSSNVTPVSVTSDSPGGFTNLAQGATKWANAAGQKYINSKLGGMLGGGDKGDGFGTPRNVKGKYGFAQLKQLWIAAGGPASAATIMAHVALAESGGDPNARNPSGASGLWQILGQVVPGNIFDPMVNARNAVAKYRAGGLAPWTASRGTWGKYAARGGFVNRLQRFAKGARVKGPRKGSSFGGSSIGKAIGKFATPGGTLGGEAGAAGGLQITLAPIRKMNRMNNDRVADYTETLDQIDKAEFDYTIANRRYDRTEEEPLNDDGTLNLDAIKTRSAELDNLALMRKKIAALYERAKEIAQRVVDSYRVMVKRLRASLAHAKGKSRGAIKGEISKITALIPEWLSNTEDARQNVIMSQEDAADLYAEKAGLQGTEASSSTGGGSSELDPYADFDTSGFDLSDLSTSSATAAASPLDIAKAAAEQIAAFNSNRLDLFNSFGSNFVTPAMLGKVDETIAAAGVRAFGATTSGDIGVQTGTTNNVTNIFPTPPPDPHTWSAQTKDELDTLTR